MVNRNQIAVIGSVVVLMGLLLSLEIKGLVKPTEQNGAGGTSIPEVVSATVTLEDVSASAKKGINVSLAEQISKLEETLANAPAEQKPALYKQLAQSWDDVNEFGPAAFYYELIAEDENTNPGWLKAGDLFTSAYNNTENPAVQKGLVQKAIKAYKNALLIDSLSLDAKTGLGTAYVSDESNPMQGIEMLLSVVKQAPGNVKANMSLGLFSIKSGQFDKAVERFKAVTDQQQNAEAWFYLASSYESLGKIQEAISAFEKSKEIAADPNLSRYVDQKIQELKK